MKRKRRGSTRTCGAGRCRREDSRCRRGATRQSEECRSPHEDRLRTVHSSPGNWVNLFCKSGGCPPHHVYKIDCINSTAFYLIISPRFRFAQVRLYPIISRIYRLYTLMNLATKASRW